MTSLDQRLQALLAPVQSTLARAPAWFAAAPQPAPAATWDWLSAPVDGAMEVTEFAVSEGFIEALFGVRCQGEMVRMAA